MHFSNELPHAYATTRITVDLTNAAFITNCSTKPICCFASGGFALFDYKPDPVEHLGNDVEKVMFRSTEELNDKLDYFLTHERERESLADHLRNVIHRKCSFTDSVYEPAVRILAEHAGSGIWAGLKGAKTKILGGMLRRPSKPQQLDEESDGPVGPMTQLAEIKRVPIVDASWQGASVTSQTPMQVRTASSAWGYSALFLLPKQLQQAGAHAGLWIQASVRMINGRAGVGLMLDDSAMVEELVVTFEDGVRTLSLPLRASGQRGVIIRSAGAASSTLELISMTLVADRRFSVPKRLFSLRRDSIPIQLDYDSDGQAN